jgi:hypothetical protein
MLIKSIYYINYDYDDSDMTAIENSNIDIFVKLKNGSKYVVTLATPEYMAYYMDNQNINYFPTMDPYIIVKKLTHEIIVETIKAYAEEEHGYSLQEGYNLKLYHFAQRIPETVFKKLQAEDEAQKESDKAFKELYGDKYTDYSPLYGGYESYESDENEEVFTSIKF